MAKEKLILTDEDRKLASAISDLTKEKQCKIEEILTDPEHRDIYLFGIKNTAQQKFDTAKEVLDILEEKEQREYDKKAEEENQKFLEIEKRVLSTLSDAKQKRVIAMREEPLKLYDNGDRFETSYKQFILMTDRKEVVETDDAVVFVNAHKKLYRKELQLPKTEDGMIFDGEYYITSGEDIIRREIQSDILNKDNKHHHYIDEAKALLMKEGKDIATEENAFAAILELFEWTEEQKIRAMQFFTDFYWWGIIFSENGKYSFLRFRGFREHRSSPMTSATRIDNYKNGPLFIVENC